MVIGTWNEMKKKQIKFNRQNDGSVKRFVLTTGSAYCIRHLIYLFEL